MSKKYRCGNCGSNEVSFSDTTGPFPWKDYPAACLIKPISLLTCEKCGEHVLRHADIDSLDKAIEESLIEFTRTLITEITAREDCTQEELALRLGITPQHLSALKSGAKIPGWQTFNFLKILYLDEKAFKKASPDVNIGARKVVG